MSLHRCTEPQCPYEGQTSTRSCRCHKTDEQMQKEALEKIAGGHLSGAGTMIVNGDWRGFATALQEIAREALRGPL